METSEVKVEAEKEESGGTGDAIPSSAQLSAERQPEPPVQAARTQSQVETRASEPPVQAARTQSQVETRANSRSSTSGHSLHTSLFQFPPHPIPPPQPFFPFMPPFFHQFPPFLPPPFQPAPVPPPAYEVPVQQSPFTVPPPERGPTPPVSLILPPTSIAESASGSRLATAVREGAKAKEILNRTANFLNSQLVQKEYIESIQRVAVAYLDSDGLKEHRCIVPLSIGTEDAELISCRDLLLLLARCGRLFGMEELLAQICSKNTEDGVILTQTAQSLAPLLSDFIYENQETPLGEQKRKQAQEAIDYLLACTKATSVSSSVTVSSSSAPVLETETVATPPSIFTNSETQTPASGEAAEKIDQSDVKEGDDVVIVEVKAGEQRRSRDQGTMTSPPPEGEDEPANEKNRSTTARLASEPSTDDDEEVVVVSETAGRTGEGTDETRNSPRKPSNELSSQGAARSNTNKRMSRVVEEITLSDDEEEGCKENDEEVTIVASENLRPSGPGAGSARKESADCFPSKPKKIRLSLFSDPKSPMKEGVWIRLHERGITTVWSQDTVLGDWEVKNATWMRKTTCAIYKRVQECFQTNELYQQKLRTRKVIIELLRDKLLDPLGGSISIIGSSLCECASSSSGIDLCAVFDIRNKRINGNKQSFFAQDSAKLLGSTNGFSEVARLGNKVTCFFEVKNKDGETQKIPVLLTVNYFSAQAFAFIQNSYCLVDRRFGYLCVWLKQWCARNLEKTAGALNSFTLTSLLLHFLQCGVNPPILPSLHILYPERFGSSARDADFAKRPYNEKFVPPLPKAENKQDLGSLLLGFFTYFALFDYARWGISIKDGMLVDRKFCGQVAAELYIVHPFDGSPASGHVRLNQFVPDFKRTAESMLNRSFDG